MRGVGLIAAVTFMVAAGGFVPVVVSSTEGAEPAKLLPAPEDAEPPPSGRIEIALADGSRVYEMFDRGDGNDGFGCHRLRAPMARVLSADPLRTYRTLCHPAWTDEAVAVATKHANVHIDTSAWTVRRYPAPLVDWLRSNGARKVLFGSNYPMIAPAKALDGLDDLDLSPETRALFLGGNAQRVYGIDV